MDSERRVCSCVVRDTCRCVCAGSKSDQDGKVESSRVESMSSRVVWRRLGGNEVGVWVSCHVCVGVTSQSVFFVDGIALRRVGVRDDHLRHLPFGKARLSTLQGPGLDASTYCHSASSHARMLVSVYYCMSICACPSSTLFFTSLGAGKDYQGSSILGFS